MTAVSSGRPVAEVVNLPLDESDAQACPRPRARAREAATLRDLPVKRQRSREWLATQFAGGSVWHTPPLSLVDARARHHHAAGVFNGWLARSLRLAWAYLVHLPVKSATHAIDWLTESPARFAVAAVLIICAWRWG